jgi:hypothetical protein
MKTVRQAWSLVLSLLLALLAGCESGGHFTFLGYTTQPTFDTTIRNVYVPIALNVSYAKNVEFDLTQAVLTELNTRAGAPRVTSNRSCADSELVMKIVLPRKSVILTNQEGETREAETAFSIEVVWRDLRPGHVGDILSNPKRYNPDELPLPGEGPATAPNPIPLLITPTANYIPELGGSNVSAQALACRRAARQIVNMMEVWK